MPFLNVYFTGDIHGSEKCFRKLLRAGEYYDVRLLVIAGDLAGKGMVPLVKNNSAYHAEFAGVEHTLGTDAELREFEGMVSDAGFYPYRTTPEQVAALRAQPDQSAELVDRLVAQRLERWVEQLEASARKGSYTYYLSPGNDDPFCVDPILNSSRVVVNPEEKVVPLNDQLAMFTYGYTNPTPWNTERELPEDQLYARMGQLLRQVRDPARTVFTLHAPPYGTTLDLAPRLTADFRIKGTFGEPPVEHVGSTAVRRVIEECQPLVAVHGHIHECAGVDRIGKTRCFNPGSEYGQGVLRGLVLTFEVGKKVQFKNYLSLSG